MSCVVDHILLEFNTLFLKRFRTYKIATPPQTKIGPKFRETLPSKKDPAAWRGVEPGQQQQQQRQQHHAVLPESGLLQCDPCWIQLHQVIPQALFVLKYKIVALHHFWRIFLIKWPTSTPFWLYKLMFCRRLCFCFGRVLACVLVDGTPAIAGVPAITGVLNFLASLLADIVIGGPAVSDFPVAAGDPAFVFFSCWHPCCCWGFRLC